MLRWGAVGLGVCALIFGTQLLEIVPPFGDAGTRVAGSTPQPTRSTAETNRDTVEAGLVRDEYCHPRVGTPRVRPVSPKVTRAVNRQWRRIERWLRVNAPESRRTLGRPGRARTIAIAEAQMGVRFPDDLRASLLRHDGAVPTASARGFGFLGKVNLSVRGIRDTWRQLCGVHDEVKNGQPGDGAHGERWHGRMIPFGADGSGGHLVIDSFRRDVGRAGRDGGVMSLTSGETPIRSYYALLKATADALETGGPVGDWKPGATGGELRWDLTRAS
ncbi:cell wall assembly regulator SMI1 [Streptosporangium becharense]|nr:cell wall assembly regulator SMI1 [Streptosporangium becharense]